MEDKMYPKRFIDSLNTIIKNKRESFDRTLKKEYFSLIISNNYVKLIGLNYKDLLKAVHTSTGDKDINEIIYEIETNGLFCIDGSTQYKRFMMYFGNEELITSMINLSIINY